MSPPENIPGNNVSCFFWQASKNQVMFSVLCPHRQFYSLEVQVACSFITSHVKWAFFISISLFKYNAPKLHKNINYYFLLIFNLILQLNQNK